MARLAPLESLFVVEHGTKLDLNKMEPSPPEKDAIAFIGRSGERNGIVGFVRPWATKDPCEAGVITVALGGSALASFVQRRRSYTAQNVDVLRPRGPMSLDVKLYYCACIEANRFRYSTFGREAHRTLRTLLVPALEAVPSWVAGTTLRAAQQLSADLEALAGPGWGVR